MSSYQEVLQQAQSLTPEEQIRLIEDLSSLIRQRVTMTSKPKHSILDSRFNTKPGKTSSPDKLTGYSNTSTS